MASHNPELVRITATRSDTTKSIHENNLHRKFDLNHPILKDFITYSQSVRGNLALRSSAREQAACVSRYLYWCDNSKLDTIFATIGRKFNDYIDAYLQLTTVQASTLRNYCRAIIEFSKYVSHKHFRRTDSKGKFEGTISKTKMSLRTSFARRRSHVRSMLNHHHLPSLSEYSKLDKLKTKMTSHIKSASGLNREEINTVTSYLITRLALKNAARSSHVCNLTLRDFENGVHVGKVFQVQCTFSKSKDKKPIVTLDREDLKLTRDYITHVRPVISQDSSSPTQPLFPNNKGSTMKNFSTARHMYKIMHLCGINPFSLTSWRKAVTTQASRKYSSNARTLRLINQYLCHTEDVALYYYTESMRPTESLESFQSIQKLLE